MRKGFPLGALRNPLPDTPPLRRKPPAAEKKNYTYDRERMRKSSGYGMVPDSAFADLPRLTRSGSFTLLVLGILRYAGFESGAKAQSLKSCNAFTEAIPDEFWASCCGTDIRELQRNYDYGVRAKVIERTKVGASHSKLRLRLEAWSELPDYKEWLRANLHEVTAETDDEPEEDDAAANDATDVQLLKAPGKVKPGRICRPLKIEVGVKEFFTDWTDVPASALPCGLTYLPEIKAGRLGVKFALDQSLAKKSAGEDKANKKRHGCRAFTTPSPRVRQTKKRTEGETLDPYSHPKAATLCEIFNPILEKSRLTMLEANPKALQAACEAMDGLSTNDLIEFLGKGRARRQLSSPRIVALIIGDAKRDRDARAKLPEDERTVTMEEIDRLIAEERAARKAKK